MADYAPDKRTGRGEIESAHFAQHDLREVFSRENANRRREGGHTLRKYLTDKQDKQILASFVKIRDQFAITNNSDAVVVWAQQLIAAGKENELHPQLVEAAKTIVVPEREEGFEAGA